MADIKKNRWVLWLISLLLLTAYPLFLFIRHLQFQKQISKNPSYAFLADFGDDWISSRKKYKKALREIKSNVDRMDKNGKSVWCVQQMFTELQWLVQATDRQEDIDRLFKEIRIEISENSSRPKKDAQNPQDGSWGTCHREWFFRLDVSVDHINDLSHSGLVPKYQTHFLDRINSPELLKFYLDSLLVSNIAKEKTNHRKELNYAIPGLVRLILKNRPKNYSYRNGLNETLLEFIRHWQNPETGCWGAWYTTQGETIKTDDLSITFHLLSYLDGKMPRKGLIVQTILKNRLLPYPYGLMEDERYTTHHNYDAVRLFRFGWEELSESAREEVRTEIKKMLKHCLEEVLLPDGSFQISSADDSVGDAYYFGVSFLDEIGFFDSKKRFWTTTEFPEAIEIKKRILNSAHSVSNPNLMLKDALEKLR